MHVAIIAFGTSYKRIVRAKTYYGDDPVGDPDLLPLPFSDDRGALGEVAAVGDESRREGANGRETAVDVFETY